MRFLIKVESSQFPKILQRLGERNVEVLLTSSRRSLISVEATSEAELKFIEDLGFEVRKEIQYAPEIAL
jgi:hypothetical protein